MLDFAGGSQFSFYQWYFGISYGGVAPTPLIKNNIKKGGVLFVGWEKIGGAFLKKERHNKLW